MARVCKTLAAYREIVKSSGISPIEESVSRTKLIGIVHLFEQVSDVRCSGMIDYPLSEILMIAFLAILANADTWVEIANFGRVKETWLKTFLPLKNGIPSHDTFQRVFGLLKKEELQRITVQYLENIMNEIGKTLAEIHPEKKDCPDTEQEEEYRHLSMDGKEERGSGRKKGTEEEVPNIQTLHIYDCSSGICLKSEPIDQKTNEIPVGQALLRLMNLKGCVVTADALHTQKKTCETIIKQGGNYVLGLKGNHKGLLEEASLCFTEEELKKAKKTKENKNPRYIRENEKTHNQIEKRRFYILEAYHEPADKDDVWAGLKSYIRFEKDIENLTTHKTHTEIRYYISSLSDLALCAGLIRGHWGVENSLHWQLDYTFGFDENSTMNKEAYTNLGLMKKMVLSLLKLFQPLLAGRKSLRSIRKIISWDPEKWIPDLFHTCSKETIRETLLLLGKTDGK